MLLPKITIITATYNCKDTIELTIQSVLSQDYPDIEYIIIDGASNDGTIEIIKKYSGKISRWISEPDGGLYDALNKGVEMATGEWIGLLNSGDLFSSDRVIRNIFKNRQYSEDIGVIYGDSIVVEGKKKSYRKAVPFISTKLPPQYRHGASFVRANIHKEFLYDVSKKNKYGYSLDYHQICCMFRSGIKFQYIETPVLEYLKEGMSNRPLHNKYMRALSESGGKYNLFFLQRLTNYLLYGIINKIKMI